MQKTENRITYYIGDVIDEFKYDEEYLNKKMEGVARMVQKQIVKEAYAKAIFLTMSDMHGEVYPIDCFARMVKRRSIKVFDGCGFYLNTNGQRTLRTMVECNPDILERAKLDGAVFVDWYPLAFRHKGGD